MRDWDAVETAERIRRREVSRREVVEAAIERAKAAHHLGGVVTETFERARASAERAEGPLAGVPTFIKDLVHVKGVPIGWGTDAVRGAVSKRSDPSVGHLSALGLVSLGKSATPELGMTGTTEPLSRPPTRNPWDPSRSSGGSSGGAASLVASGVVPIAHASDGGGSIRIPAASCGLVGLKPSRGRLDIEASRLLPINVGVHGVVTRTVRDTVAFWNGIDARTRTRFPIGAVRPSTGTLRIGFFTRSPLGRGVERTHAEAVESTARTLESMGHTVEPIDCPFPESIIRDFVRYWAMLAWVQDRGGRALVHPSFERSRLEPWTRGLSAWCEREPRELASALRRLRRFARAHAEAKRPHDVILCPVLGQAPPLHGHLATDVPFDDALSRILDHFPFTGILNATGEPALSLPLARGANDLPIGVQLVGRMHDDATLLSLALSLEEALPWPRTAPTTQA